jgi:hypothetical protein
MLNIIAAHKLVQQKRRIILKKNHDFPHFSDMDSIFRGTASTHLSLET